MCEKFTMNLTFYFSSFTLLQVSATDPDCGVNAVVNYTLGDGFKKLTEFDVKSATGDICISGDLDFEMRSSYELPIIATDRGKYLTIFIFFFCTLGEVIYYASI